MWQTNLIKLYCAVCDNSSTIEAVTQRQSNNFRPQFSDEECITLDLWGISQRRFEQKTIYGYTKNHLLEWFPKLPSYQAFSDRLNRLAPAFQVLAEQWLSVIGVNLQGAMEYLIMPHARVMIHDPLIPGGVGGSALKLDAIAKDLMRTREVTASWPTVPGIPWKKFTQRRPKIHILPPKKRWNGGWLTVLYMRFEGGTRHEKHGI